MTADRIRIMISSRCEDTIRRGSRESVKLTELRKEAKKTIEDTQLFKRDTFDCWIHEDKPALSVDRDAWEGCLAQARRCHILVILYNGNAGFGLASEEVGICHAEMMAALDTGPGKVRVIDITKASKGRVSGDPKRNQRFDVYIKAQALPVSKADDYQQALDRIVEAVQDAVVELTLKGAISLRTGRYATGTPLVWTRYDYAHRKQAIEEILLESLSGETATEDRGCLHVIDGIQVYFRCHAVPAAMSVAAAREMVGRPFLQDHESLPSMPGDVVGPVHVIGCHKGVTETQAVSLLGFPDATIVPDEFGVYVADNVQMIQMIFLANCRDESLTRLAVQRFQGWLRRSGETSYLLRRALSRKVIVAAIAGQLGASVKKAVG